MFVFDKIGVMLTGHPPLLSHRYYTAPLPLDLRDEDLIADADTLNRAINSLDDRGWNTDGGLYPATVARARCMMAIIRDELIEVTMRNGRNPSLEQLLYDQKFFFFLRLRKRIRANNAGRDLKEREYAVVAEFPTGLKFDPQDLEAPKIEIRCLYMKIITHLEHLQNIFFIDRLLIRCGYAIRDNLLETSMTLSSLTLHFWTHKNEFSGWVMQRSFEWLVGYFISPFSKFIPFSFLTVNCRCLPMAHLRQEFYAKRRWERASTAKTQASAAPLSFSS